MSRPEEYAIEKTVWRSGRKNPYGDELVVAQGKVNNKKAFVMAWEVKANRPETVSWNGDVSYFPRMHWLDEIPADHIKIYNYQEDKEYHIKNDKHYKVIDGDVYIKFNKDENNNLQHPSFLSITYNPSAKTKAINYVLWFNENQKQLDEYSRLLSTSKQARKRRRRRAYQSAKRINTTND
tara:strand:- start:1798 stop:2337 length:540 start_codon:yes stop_codon:yes gene_type:complete